MSVADQIVAALDEVYSQEHATKDAQFRAITAAWFGLRRKVGVEQFDAAVDELLADDEDGDHVITQNEEREAGRGLAVPVLLLGALAGLVALIAFFHIAGWPGALIVLVIGVLSGLAARRYAGRGEGK